MKKQIMALLLVIVFCSTLIPMQAGADGEAFAMQITVNGEQKAVRAYNDSYEGNLYLSLTDLAAALGATEKRSSPPRTESISPSQRGRPRSLDPAPEEPQGARPR